MFFITEPAWKVDLAVVSLIDWLIYWFDWLDGVVDTLVNNIGDRTATINKASRRRLRVPCGYSAHLRVVAPLPSARAGIQGSTADRRCAWIIVCRFRLQVVFRFIPVFRGVFCPQAFVVTLRSYGMGRCFYYG